MARCRGLQAVSARTYGRVPFMVGHVQVGFPSPADDYLDNPLDFNELLIAHPAATFAVRVAGDSMVRAGIFAGDIVVVDRAEVVKDGCIVLAIVDGEFTIKRYRVRGRRVWLEAANPAFKDLELRPDLEFQVWGVAKHSIRML